MPVNDQQHEKKQLKKMIGFSGKAFLIRSELKPEGGIGTNHSVMWGRMFHVEQVRSSLRQNTLDLSREQYGGHESLSGRR